MKNNQKTGSAKVIIVSCLAAALFILAGLIVWQVMKRDGDSVNPPGENAGRPVEVADLKVPEWKVVFPYDKAANFGAKKLTYDMSYDDSAINVYPDSDIYRANNSCDGGMYVSIRRGSANELVDQRSGVSFANAEKELHLKVAQFGKFYYVVTNYGVGECEGGDTINIQLDTVEIILLEAISNIRNL